MSKSKLKHSLASPVSVQHEDWRSRTVLTLDEVREILRISRPNAYKMAATGKLPSFKIGTAIRIRVRDVAAIIDGKAAA